MISITKKIATGGFGATAAFLVVTALLAGSSEGAARGEAATKDEHSSAYLRAERQGLPLTTLGDDGCKAKVELGEDNLWACLDAAAGDDELLQWKLAEQIRGNSPSDAQVELLAQSLQLANSEEDLTAEEVAALEQRIVELRLEVLSESQGA